VFRNYLFAPYNGKKVWTPKASSEHTKQASSTSFLDGDFFFLGKPVSFFIGSPFWSSEAVCLLHQRQGQNALSWQVQLSFWVATSSFWSSLFLSSLAYNFGLQELSVCSTKG
jgi:hypothetical protein